MTDEVKVSAWRAGNIRYATDTADNRLIAILNKYKKF